MSNQSTGECCVKCKITGEMKGDNGCDNYNCPCHTAIPEWEERIKNIIANVNFLPNREIVNLIKIEFSSLISSKDKEIAMEREKVVREILNGLPLRSDWDDDVKVTFQMGIDVVRENLNELLSALQQEKE